MELYYKYYKYKMWNYITRNRLGRISIEDHELSNCVSIYDWKDRIRNLIKHVKIEWSTKYELLMNDIYDSYHHHIPFHNHTHAYDVLQLGICLLVKCNVFKKISYDQRFTFCIALLCHDIDHRGHTNSDLGKNDEYDSNIEEDSESLNSYCSSHSHNEKHHLSTTCRLLKKHNIPYDKPLLGTLIAHTDLARHKSFIDNIHYKKVFNIEDQLIVLIKLADIGHILRPWKVHMHFVNAINMERINPLSITDLPCDTINFNRNFVYPILLLLKKTNSTLFTELNAYYDKNLTSWIGINDFVSMNKVQNQICFPN